MSPHAIKITPISAKNRHNTSLKCLSINRQRCVVSSFHRLYLLSLHSDESRLTTLTMGEQKNKTQNIWKTGHTPSAYFPPEERGFTVKSGSQCGNLDNLTLNRRRQGWEQSLAPNVELPRGNLLGWRENGPCRAMVVFRPRHARVVLAHQPWPDQCHCGLTSEGLLDPIECVQSLQIKNIFLTMQG